MFLFYYLLLPIQCNAENEQFQGQLRQMEANVAQMQIERDQATRKLDEVCARAYLCAFFFVAMLSLPVNVERFRSRWVCLPTDTLSE